MDNTFASFDEWAAAQARCDAAYEAAYEIDPSTAYDAYRAASDVEIAAARRRRADEALEAAGVVIVAADELSATERAAIDALETLDFQACSSCPIAQECTRITRAKCHGSTMIDNIGE